MTGSERMQAVASVLFEAAQIAREAMVATSPDETINETSLAYFAGHVAAILVIAERLEKAVNRIDGWQKASNVAAKN